LRRGLLRLPQVTQIGPRRSCIFNKVNVFGDDYSVRLASLLKDLRILGTEEPKNLNVYGLLCEVISKPAGKRGWKLGIDPHHKD
jgi:hypothetical protein